MSAKKITAIQEFLRRVLNHENTCIICGNPILEEGEILELPDIYEPGKVRILHYCSERCVNIETKRQKKHD